MATTATATSAAAAAAATKSALALPTTWSMSGCGWLCCYHLGAIRALQERPRLMKESTFIGASGGALAAGVAALDADTLKAQDLIKRKAMAARSWPVDLFRLKKLVREGVDLVVEDVFTQRETGYKKRVDGTDPLDDDLAALNTGMSSYITAPEVRINPMSNMVPPSYFQKPSLLTREKAAREQEQLALLESGGDAAAAAASKQAGRDWESCRQMLKDRCHIYITELPSWRTLIAKDFETQEQFAEALIASSTIPPFAGMPFRMKHGGPFHGKLVIDGGFGNMLPRRQERGTVVTLSPFVQLPFHVDVTPLVHGHGMVARWALLPPDALQLDAVFWCGYRDMDAFLVHNRYDDVYGDRRKALMEAQEEVALQLEAAEREAVEARKLLEAATEKKKPSASASSSSKKAKKGAKDAAAAASETATADEVVDDAPGAADEIPKEIVAAAEKNKSLAAKVAEAESKAVAVRVVKQELAAISFLQKEKVSSQRRYDVNWVDKHVLRFMPTLTVYYLRVIWSWIFMYLLYRAALFVRAQIERAKDKKKKPFWMKMMGL